ncbi:uncharacterized protein LOC142344306 [Convolutriloba macropyga]|uniref:uncharacterized protein LOC142344306 n=1 Tax=Convolutriloba macropyga TaxID=536237 RepID=UPI003F51DD2F
MVTARSILLKVVLKLVVIWVSECQNGQKAPEDVSTLVVTEIKAKFTDKSSMTANTANLEADVQADITALKDAGCTNQVTSKNGQTAGSPPVLYVVVTFCDKDVAKTKDQLIKDAITKWTDTTSVGTYKYAGADKKIVSECLDGQNQPEVELDDLKKNVFLAIGGMNTPDATCFYMKEETDKAKKGQYLDCFLKQTADLTADSITKAVFFSKQFFTTNCATYNIPVCTSSSEKCTPNTGGGGANDVTADVAAKLKAAIPEMTEAATDQDATKTKASTEVKGDLSSENGEGLSTDAITKWTDTTSVGTYKYAGADKKIVSECLDGQNQPEVELDDLKKNVFLAIGGMNTPDATCFYMKEETDKAKKGQYLDCFLKQTADLTADSITKAVFFSKQFFTTNCATYNIPVCTSSSEKCTPNTGGGGANDVTADVAAKLKAAIPEMTEAATDQDATKTKASTEVKALADVGCATTATAEGKTANDATQNLIWAQVSYCVTDLSTTKNQESFIKESVHAWLDQVKNFKYAGADKKIIDDCKKSDGNAELKLDELLKNTFLISVGVNNKNMGCSYLDQTQGSETGAIKAQFILCAFEQKAEVTAVSITKNVYFGDEVFNKHCDQTSTYKIEKCSSNNQQCTASNTKKSYSVKLSAQ